MVANIHPTENNQLCALVSKANGEEPIGSAVSFEQCLVMELPLPWPRDAWQAGHVPQEILAVLKRAEARGGNVRPQAILPDWEYSVPGKTRLFHYRRPAENITQYEKQEYVVPEAEVEALVVAIFEAPDRLPSFAPYRQATENVREILVCTHGSRDTCCGSFGVPIYQTLREQYTAASNGQLRVWRTSHTGGHRFAPTLIDFPQGHYWGRVEVDMLDLLINRTGPVSGLGDFYRGWSALSTLEQVVEREIWLKEGWDWLNYQKTSRVLSLDEAANRADVEVTFTPPKPGPSGVYEATVEQYDTVRTLPSSGSGPLREEPLYRVSRLAKRS